jgi:hypothetical protein
LKNLFIFGLCLSLIGCATAPESQVKPFDEPQYGMTKRQLIDMFGKPDSLEIYQKPDKTRIEFDTYVRVFPSSEEKVPVCLVDNKVVGWGKTFYEDHVSTDYIRIK